MITRFTGCSERPETGGVLKDFLFLLFWALYSMVFGVTLPECLGLLFQGAWVYLCRVSGPDNL